MENYEGQNLVGEGSFGRVYKAIDKRNNQVVALKVIRKQGRSSKELQSFQRECEIQQHLRHPNIILMLDSFDTSSVMVVVTEFAHRDLHGILREGSLEENRAQKLTWDLVSALYYLHSHRILHRDLKPQNILLDLNGRAKLCDFGLARNMTAGTHVLTSIKGTPLYMAPELMAEQPYDYLADFWSLGCIIYETLVGETPFYSTSILQLVRKLRHDNVRWPSIISETCVSFLQGLLQKDPSDRMTWAVILEHPFVNDHVIILEEEIPESPFTHPLSASQSKTKERQHSLAKEHKPIHQTSSSTENECINDCKFIETSHVLPAEEVSKRASFSFCTSDSVIVHDTQSVRDSLKTQGETSEVETMSDIEGLKIVKRVSTDPMTNYKFNHKQQVLNLNVDHISVLNPYARFSTSNLVVTKMNSNKDTNLLDASTISPNVITLSASDRNNKVVKQQTQKLNKSDLQKRKLSQNLDNFSLKLGQADADFSSGKLLANGSEAKVTKSVVRSKSDLVHSKHKILPKDKINKCVNSLTDKVFNMRLNESISSTKKSKRVVQNLLNDANILPISESVDNNATSEYTNECSKAKIQSNADSEIVNVLTESNAVKEPLNTGDEAKDFEGPVLPLGVAWEDSERPLENDEWLAFLNKTMLEVIDGEIDSFKEQNFVSIIVSPLRHHGVSSEVARSVANLLALPLVVPRTNQSVLSSIRNVYLEVKLVPNLIYAAVLLCGRRHMSTLPVDNSLEAHSFIQKQTCRSLTELSVADLQALESINLLVCHLVLCGEYFTSQFCDAIVVLSAKSLIQGFLDLAKRNTRLACDVLAVLNNTLCVLPENAELVVGIVLDGGVEQLVKLLAHPDALIKTRTCVLLKLLGHFSCNSLQTYWCPELQNALENLLADSSQNVASVAGDVIAELKTLSFYEQLTN